MELNRYFNLLLKHINDNLWLYILSGLCICTGVVIGAYSVKYMDEGSKSDLLNYINVFNASKTTDTVPLKDIYISSIKNNITIIASIWFLGLTMIGLPITLIFEVIKGFTLGFTFSFFVSVVGSKGLAIALIGVLPQNFIYIPLTILASIFSMQFSISILKDSFSVRKSVFSKISRYTFKFLIIILVMNIGFFLESVVSPFFLKFF